MNKFWLFLFLPSLAWSQIHPSLGIGVGRFNGDSFIYPSFIGSVSGALETHSIGLEMSFNHIQQHTDNDTMRDGNLTLIPLMFNLYASPPISSHWRMIAKGGLSYVFCDRELSPKTLKMEGYPNYKISEEVKAGIGYQFGGGLQYIVNRKVSISFEVLQLFFTSTIKHTRKDLNDFRSNAPVYEDKGEMELNSILGMVVIKRYF